MLNVWLCLLKSSICCWNISVFWCWDSVCWKKIYFPFHEETVTTGFSYYKKCNIICINSYLFHLNIIWNYFPPDHLFTPLIISVFHTSTKEKMSGWFSFNPSRYIHVPWPFGRIYFKVAGRPWVRKINFGDALLLKHLMLIHFIS